MSSLLLRDVDQARAPQRRAGLWRVLREQPPGRVVAAFAVLAGILRLPLVARPLSSDEGGFLMVAAQWHPGTSLYGDYWVDRPPLLITLFRIADLAGGEIALRVLGIVAAVVSVLLAARLGRIVVPTARWAPVLCAATATVFVCMPLFDPVVVNGELLALPFAMGGIVAVLTAARSGPWASGWWLVAGAAAVAAAAVKQSALEVFAAAAAALALVALRDRRLRVAAEGAVAFVAGAGVTGIALLLWAGLHGTTVAGLWDAVVTFRGEASAVVATSASSATTDRAELLLVSIVASGAPALVALAALPSRLISAAPTRRVGSSRDGSAAKSSRLVPTRPVQAPETGRLVGTVAAAVLAWELFAVAAGGSYWLHYLVGTIPGLVLCAAVVVDRRPNRVQWFAVGLVYSAVVAMAAAATMIPIITAPTTETAVEDYLADHARPGDTGVVAFGDPELLQASGLSSPYPQLWSLPVRVRDPDLVQFGRVLSGPERPTWVVVDGESLDTWGIDATTANQVLDREYRLEQVIGDWHLYHVR